MSTLEAHEPVEEAVETLLCGQFTAEAETNGNAPAAEYIKTGNVYLPGAVIATHVGDEGLTFECLVKQSGIPEKTLRGIIAL